MNLPHRPRDERVLAGTAAALAQASGLPLLLIRLLFVLLTLANGAGILLYALLSLLLPDEESHATDLATRVRENIDEFRESATALWAAIQNEARAWQVRRLQGDYLTRKRALLGALLLLAGGVWFLMTLDLLAWITFERLVAIVIVTAGAYLISTRT